MGSLVAKTGQVAQYHHLKPRKALPNRLPNNSQVDRVVAVN